MSALARDLQAARETEALDTETGLFMYAFTAEEIMSLRRQLLPNRMAHHDTSGEARLRQHVNSIKKRRGEKAMD